jgi:hypothetical protein
MKDVERVRRRAWKLAVCVGAVVVAIDLAGWPGQVGPSRVLSLARSALGLLFAGLVITWLLIGRKLESSKNFSEA